MSAALLLVPLLACGEGLSVSERADLLDHSDPHVRGRAAVSFLKELKEGPADAYSEARDDIAASLRHIRLTPEVLPLALWFLDESPDQKMVCLSMDVDWKSPSGRALVQRVVRKQPLSAKHLHRFLHEMAMFEVPLADEDLARLAQHHRPLVRKAARDYAEALRRPAPKRFDPTKAMKSPAIRSLLKRIHDELPDPPPATARLVADADGDGVRPPGKEAEPRPALGWLLAKHDDRVVVLAGLRKMTISTAPVKDAHGKTSRFRVVPMRPTDEVRWQERDKPNLGDVGHGDSTRPLVLAWWLHRTGQDALAWRVLEPWLLACDEDEELLADLRIGVGREYGERMLEAFANSRDFREALRLARLVVHRYPASPLRPEAKQLLAELPHRLNDFKDLKLPTPARWAALKKHLTRAEQIDFLCRRLRLMSIGGKYGPRKQYAERAGPDFPYVRGGGYGDDPVSQREAERRAGKGRTEVIDPYLELGHMGLGLKDVPFLARHLRENWHLTTVTFTSDTGPFRGIMYSYSGLGYAREEPTLDTMTRPILVRLINGLARGPICRSDDPDGAVRWARAHAELSPADLEWYWLRREWAAGIHWSHLRRRIDALWVMGDRRVVRLLHALLRDGKTSEVVQAELLQLYAEPAPQQARHFARYFLTARDESLRIRAAILCLHTRDGGRARAVLGESLRNAGKRLAQFRRAPTSHVPEVVAELHADGTGPSLRAAARVFEGNLLVMFWAGWCEEEVRLALARVKAAQPHTFYLQSLRCTKAIHRGPISELAAKEVCEGIGKGDPVVEAIKREYPDPADRVPHLEKWLKVRIAAPKAKPPAKE
jgi:hypothetical protein